MEEALTQRQVVRRPVKPLTQAEEKRERIPVWMGVTVSVIALSIDGFQALLTPLAIGVVLNSIITAGAWLGFWIFFMTREVSLIKNPARLSFMGIAGIGELIPILNALPVLSAGIMGTIIVTMIEDGNGIIKNIGNVINKIK